uniref:uncharacterized protein LOC122599344 n=1 Tax=Erigeron canadensis TaxID=72917 RepID=UPI001CB92409|nr:uncharacterized protein LOC122599344 [Erigeron canadensis]
MSSDDWPDWLPADWTMQIKKIDQRKVKCYVDSQGHKCYSKPQVFDYLKKIGGKEAHVNTDNANGSTLDLSMEPENEVIGSSPGGPPAKLATRSSRKKPLAMHEAEGVSSGVGSPSEPLSSERSHGDSSWLPDGWTVEVKTRKGGNSTGMRYKCYTDPLSGQKFFSKPQVLSHLAKTNRSFGGQKELNTEPIIATPITAWRENASTEPGNSQTNEATEDEKNKFEKKTESARLYSERRVVTRIPAEGLPPGWIKEMRLRNDGIKRDPFFVDPSSEYVFFSKKDALRYLEAGDVKACVMKPMIRNMNADASLNLKMSGDEMASPPDPCKGIETSEVLTNGCVTDSKTNGIATENPAENPVENPKPIRSITGGIFSTPVASQKEARTRSGGSFPSPKEVVSDWLPDGWTVELHYKSSGMKYKIYKESASGKKFYSKPQVLDYLANGSSSNSRKRKDNSSVVSDSSPKPKRSSNKKDNSNFEEFITTTPAEGLPEGWIKEVRTKISGTHKRHDPYYIDPENGYIFRSKLDALRFLETGDINACAMKPKVKDKDGNEVYVRTDGVPKPAKTTGEQLVEGGENSVEKQDNDVSSAGNISVRGRVSSRIANRSNNSATTSPAQSSKRQKGVNFETGPSGGGLTEDNRAVQEKQGPGVNLEKEPDDGHLSYDIPDDDNWTDQCIDFAVKTLTDEILINGQPAPGAFQEENGGVETGVNKTPTKVN